MNYEFSDKYWEDYKNFLLLIEEQVRFEYRSDSRLIELYKSPNSIIEDWKETVDSGKDYHFTIFEWDNEISVRGLIEKIINNEELKRLEFFYQKFKARVEEIDEELKRISLDDFERPHWENWWEKKVLKGGEDQYKENIKDFYSIDLDKYRDE